MDRIANVITQLYIKKGYIDDDKKEIYNFGFKLIIADIINFSIIMIIGLFIGKALESVMFLLTLCTVRLFSSGFHAKTFWLCRLSMVITYICVTVLSNIAIRNNWINIYSVSVVDFFSVIMIAVLAPVKHPNKVLTAQQKKQNKFKAIITSLIISMMSVLLIFLKINEGVTISITLMAVVILMIIGFVVQKGG